MYPILFEYGPFILRTVGIFWVLGFLWTAFLFWRKGREEHYAEDQLLDGFIVSFLFGLLVARVGYIILNVSTFGWSVGSWLNLVTYPGGVWWLGLLASSLYIYRFAVGRKWNTFEVLDFWFTGLAAGLSIVSIGMFFDGAGAGLPTELPIGISFPGVIDRLHPAQLYWAVIYSCLGWYLSWAEYRYRTFRWYTVGKRAPQTGFLTSIFISTVGLFGLLLQPISTPSLVIGGFVIDYYVYVFALLWGIGLLYVRSGRKIPFISK